MSVLNDPTARLYAGALLGKALTKSLGEVGAQEAGAGQARRKATLEAGVASGAIRPSQLGAGDAQLLGAALQGHIKVPSLLKDPLGYLSNFAGEGGKFIDSLGSVPQALYGIGGAAAHEVGELGGLARKAIPYKTPTPTAHPLLGIIKGVEGQVAHDFSSPQQVYEHPFNPLLDVAGVASGGIGLAGKVAKAGSIAGKFSKGGSLSGLAPVAKRIINITSPEGRAPINISPGFSKGDLGGLKAEAKPQTITPRYAERPFMKYAVQKPLDVLFRGAGNVPVPTTGRTVGEIRGAYYGNKLINVAHGQQSAGTMESFLHHPVQDVVKSTQDMFRSGQPAGQYEWEAMILHNMGIDNLEKLDHYSQQIASGEDVDGVVMTPAMQKMNEHRLEVYADPRFRELIEYPTDLAKATSYQLRRANVAVAHQADIPPTVSENAAFGRMRELTGKTTEELIREQAPTLRPHNEFAKGLQGAQEVLLGKAEAGTAPSIEQLAVHLPYGTMAQRVDILTRAEHSLVQDLELKASGDARGFYALHQQADYLQGNNLYEKVATALHDELQVPEEQAVSLARGVALGSPEGPILPTYIPSASGEGLKFGVKREALKTRVGRTLGLSAFKPITHELAGLERQPTFYDFKRPFSPRTASAQTIGLPPRQGYREEADYASFLKGAQRSDPETILRNIYQINKDLVEKRLNPTLLGKLALPNADGTGPRIVRGGEEAVKLLGDKKNLYDIVPVATTRNWLNAKAGLEVNLADSLKGVRTREEFERAIEGWDSTVDEAAQKFVADETEKVAGNHVEAILLPKTYVNTLLAHIRVSEAPTGWFNRAVSAATGRWKVAVLSYMPAWLIRTTVGHGLIGLFDGTMDPRAWKNANSYFAAERPPSAEDMQRIAWGKKYGDTVLGSQKLPYGVNQGGFRQELADIGQGVRSEKQSVIPRTISSGVHVQNNFQRRAIFLAKQGKAVRQRLAELGKDFDHPGGFWNAKNIDAALDPAWLRDVAQSPDLLEHTFDQLSHVSYTFGQMAPWERRIVKYAMPFYGWYKFVSKFVWSIPVNYPGRAAMLGMIGRIGESEHEELGAMPDYLSSALWFNHEDLSKAKYINLFGLNPAADVANPFSDTGFMGGLVRMGQFSPVLQSAIAGYGINPLTGEMESIDPRSGLEKGRFGEYIDVKTGQVVPVVAHDPLQRFIGQFLRAFPEIRAAELAATGGNPVYPESIPLVSEHPLAVNPETRRSNTPLRLLEQAIGLQPGTKDLAKYQSEHLKNWLEAQRKNPKTIAKQEAKLKVPSP